MKSDIILIYFFGKAKDVDNGRLSGFRLRRTLSQRPYQPAGTLVSSTKVVHESYRIAGEKVSLLVEQLKQNTAAGP